MPKKILVVDDDALLRRSLVFQLEQAGYQAKAAANAEDAVQIVKQYQPKIILLDVGLPGMDGLEAMQHLQEGDDIPVIFITARRRELDKIIGLELGADDYITKPFNPDVLLAHIKAVLRRSERIPKMTKTVTPLKVGDMVIDPGAHTVYVGRKEIHLTAREFSLLHTLAINAGQVISSEDLLARVWGAEFIGQPQVVYVHIRWLREKIEDNPQKPTKIINVRGVGYKLVV